MDGKYCTLDQFKQYLIGTRTDPLNPSTFNQSVIGTPDENILGECILNAENVFQLVTGSSYDQQTLTLVHPVLTYVDGNGWLHLYARERGPVTAVSAVQTLDVTNPAEGWRTVTINPDLLILPPYMASDTGPHPESWHVSLYPSDPSYLPTATGMIRAKWTYTGGFSPIPPALTLLICQAATYIYKSREAPIGRVFNQPLGVISVPSNFPPAIRMQMAQWGVLYA